MTNGVGKSVFIGKVFSYFFCSRRKRRLLSKRRALVVLQKAPSHGLVGVLGESLRSLGHSHRNQIPIIGDVTFFLGGRWINFWLEIHQV